MARVLKARKNPFTIELLFLDGEEAFIDWYLGDDHTYGSRHYVQEAKRTGDLARIKAMILVDMIGDRDLVIKRETASTAWLTDAIWSAAKALGHGSTFVAESFAVEDDHARVESVHQVGDSFVEGHGFAGVLIENESVGRAAADVPGSGRCREVAQPSHPDCRHARVRHLRQIASRGIRVADEQR